MKTEINLTTYPLGCNFLSDIGCFLPVPRLGILHSKGFFIGG